MDLVATGFDKPHGDGRTMRTADDVDAAAQAFYDAHCKVCLGGQASQTGARTCTLQEAPKASRAVILGDVMWHATRSKYLDKMTVYYQVA